MLRGCYVETASVEFQLKRTRTGKVRTPYLMSLEEAAMGYPYQMFPVYPMAFNGVYVWRVRQTFKPATIHYTLTVTLVP